jgi:hypothetical protein
VAEHHKAAIAYSQAARALTQNRSICSASEHRKLQESAHDVRIKSTEARVAVKRHIAAAEFGYPAIRTISLAISSGERTKSIHPLAIALSGMSGCPAVSSFCAIVTPPTSFMPHSAAAPSPS